MSFQKVNILFLLFMVSLVSCRMSTGELSKGNQEGVNSMQNLYAKGFQIDRYKDFKILSVFNPWQHAKGVVYKYILTKDLNTIPDSLKKYDIIVTPVKRVVCLSTTHLAFIKELNEMDAVCGVSAPEYIYDSLTLQKVAKGQIRNVGYDQALDIETVISMKPDFVMAYGVGSESSGQFQRLKQLGIKVVFNAEYLERTPLGKAEWINFVGAFFDKEDTASLYFRKTASNYEALLKSASSVSKKPMVLCGLPWKGVWYVPGGKSYASNFIYDAGGDYLWKEDTGSESLPLSLETVMERSNMADFWINPGSVSNSTEIIAIDPRMKNIRSLQTKRIFNFNLRQSPGGGNDFWESGVVHPDWILKDLIAIFHPELVPNHTFVYYQNLK